MQTRLPRELSFFMLQLVLLLSAGSFARAGEGHVRIINAVATEGALNFTLGGKVLNEQGYQEGEGSGWIGLRTGAHTLKGSHPSHGSLSIPVSLKSGDRKAVVIFLKSKPSAKAGLPSQKVLRYMTLDCTRIPSVKNGGTEKQVSEATFLLLESPAPMNVRVGSQDVTLQSGQRQNVELGRMGQHVNVLAEDDSHLATLSTEEPGDHFVVVFRGNEGSMKAIAFKD